MAKLKNAALSAQHGDLLGLGKSTVTATPAGRNWLAILAAISVGLIAIGGTVGYVVQRVEMAKIEKERAEAAERKEFAGLFSKAEKMVADLEARAESRNQTMIFGGSVIFQQKYGFEPSQDTIQTVIEIAAKCPAPDDLPNREDITAQIEEARDADKEASKETGQTPKLNAVYNKMKDQFEVLRVWDAGVDNAVTTKGYGRMQLREDFKPFCNDAWVKKIEGGDAEPVAAKPVAVKPAPIEVAPVVEPEPVAELEPVSTMPPPPALPAYAQPKAQVQPEAPSFNMPPPPALPPVPAAAQIKPAPAPKPKPAPAPSSGRVQVDDW
jgi:hypothetical protein